MIKINQPEQVINLLKKRGESFLLENTTLSVTVTYNGKKYKYIDSDTELNNWELNLITSVKKYVNENIDLPVSYNKPVYVDNGSIKNFEGSFYEVDISAAFWYVAKMEGFISDEIFKKGLSEKISKKVRLIALGNLAKNTVVSFFDGKKYSEPEIIGSELTEGVFFRVAEKTGYIMQDIKYRLGKDYLFYWCDAIFFKGGLKNVQNVSDYLRQMGLPSKFYKIDKVEKGENNEYVIFSKDHKTEKRIFNF